MNILVTNDDGITSLGLLALVKIAKNFGDVTVVAPDGPRSGNGHAITIERSLYLRKQADILDSPAYACSGTPVDCVKMAMNLVFKAKPDMILSGVNIGSNSAISVVYSGTMGAAVEGALYGILSIGFSSLNTVLSQDYTPIISWGTKIVNQFLTNSSLNIDRYSAYNINFPLDSQAIKGVSWASQCKGHWEEFFEEKIDENGETSYIIDGKLENTDKENPNNDEAFLSKNIIAIVPVSTDLTNYTVLNNYKDFTFKC